jgi:hypothetical protein
MQILTNNNVDAKNHIEKDIKFNDSYISYSLGGNPVAQDFMKKLGEKLHSSLGTEVFYLKTDGSDELAILLKDKAEKPNQKTKKRPGL